MKKNAGNMKLFIFVVTLAGVFLSVGGLQAAQAAPGDPLDFGVETQTRKEREQFSEGLITPFETSPAPPLKDPEPPDSEEEQLESFLKRQEEAYQAYWMEMQSENEFFAGSVPTLLPAATNDDISSATVIASLPYTNTVDTTGATVEAGEPTYTCGYSQGASVWYSFSPSSDGYFVIDTNGTQFGSVIHVFNASGMTDVGCDYRSYDGYWASELPFYGELGETYLISISGSNAASGAMTINLRETSAFTNCAAVVDVSQAECAALRNFYNSLGGASWTQNHGWKETAEVCTWFGVWCSAGDITGLAMYTNNIIGELTTDLSVLSSLVLIDLSFNSISGDFGVIGGNLPTSLLRIYLFDNDLTGTVPSAFLDLSALITLDLGSNQFAGDFAPVLANIPTGIERVWMSGNNFNGTIPAHLQNFTSLLSLGLQYNQLEGDIAGVFDLLPASIKSLNLGGNQFYGSLPPAAGSLTSLTYLALNNNQFSSALTAITDNLPPNISYLDLSNNQFTGTIPGGISGYSSLLNLYLNGNNEIWGEIPLSITGLGLTSFNFWGTYLCEPSDASYAPWKAGVTYYTEGYCGNLLVDLTVTGITFDPANPAPSEAFNVIIHARNIGGADSTAGTYVDLYEDRSPIGCDDTGDSSSNEGIMVPGEKRDVVISYPGGLLEATYDFEAHIEIDCDQAEESEGNNHFATSLDVNSLIFTDGFESGNLSAWSSVNTGGGFLDACEEGATLGLYGACVERGTNDKRKQLKDDTPVGETSFNARFIIDINSLSMTSGERFRLMQLKDDALRPAFIVLKYQGGQYLVQLNALLDDLTKVKTGWITLPDAASTIEVAWTQSSGGDDGVATLYINGSFKDDLTGLDNDTFSINSFRTGFTSKLVGKNISGTFYIDEVATSNSGVIGPP